MSWGSKDGAAGPELEEVIGVTGVIGVIGVMGSIVPLDWLKFNKVGLAIGSH